MTLGRTDFPDQWGFAMLPTGRDETVVTVVQWCASKRWTDETSCSTEPVVTPGGWTSACWMATSIRFETTLSAGSGMRKKQSDIECTVMFFVRMRHQRCLVSFFWGGEPPKTSKTVHLRVAVPVISGWGRKKNNHCFWGAHHIPTYGGWNPMASHDRRQGLESTMAATRAPNSSPVRMVVAVSQRPWAQLRNLPDLKNLEWSRKGSTYCMFWDLITMNYLYWAFSDFWT